MPLDLAGALALTGVEPGADARSVRSARRSALRTVHPDVSNDADAHLRMVALTEAFAVIEGALSAAADRRVPEPASVPSRAADGASSVGNGGRGQGLDRPEVSVDGDTIFIGAPPDEAYQRLLESAAGIGGIGHVDRSLGLLEVIVRFEGGPSCSVLMTLQGRAFGTDVFCTMDSIEAAPTPDITPVMDALRSALSSPD